MVYYAYRKCSYCENKVLVSGFAKRTKKACCGYCGLNENDIMVSLKNGKNMVFANVDDYEIDNENGWLSIMKDDEEIGSIVLSEIVSVFING